MKHTYGSKTAWYGHIHKGSLGEHNIFANENCVESKPAEILEIF